MVETAAYRDKQSDSTTFMKLFKGHIWVIHGYLDLTAESLYVQGFVESRHLYCSSG